jgi:hypothetical protein
VGHFGDELLAPVHDELGRKQFAVGQIQVTALGLCSDCRADDAPADTPARHTSPEGT